tara:strand:- start:861 stop:1604 length:744 start_codon:yes stop_codon:yes gene_type:complete
VFELREICKSFGKFRVLNSISLKIKSGLVTGLIGPNGSGKTSLVNIMSGVYPIDSGQILLDGKDITGATSDQIYRLGVSRTFQHIRIFERMTVIENVISAIISLETLSLNELFRQVRNPEDTKFKVAQNMLEKMELENDSKIFANELPIHKRRRLEIARALAREPKVILLDEPAGGMTPKETERLALLILKIFSPGMTCLVIEHKMDLIAEVCEDLCVLNNGEKIAQGDPLVVFNQPEVIEAYIGSV